ncbi:hypothetical protein chiPu_0033513 [Chiloscyllium punctatum]|uniref:Uncharacterized protein n=1 Tax=Chiloscyllium punctatum TaxID=137246 RepID=A0A401U365_CHIPU|nr:hypothetical protein [Chiloscyllium punctatum]
MSAVRPAHTLSAEPQTHEDAMLQEEAGEPEGPPLILLPSTLPTHSNTTTTLRIVTDPKPRAIGQLTPSLPGSAVAHGNRLGLRPGGQPAQLLPLGHNTLVSLEGMYAGQGRL